MFKKMMYQTMFLSEDVAEIEKNIMDSEKVKNILGSINPKFYDKLYKSLATKVDEKRLMLQKDFRKNEKLYERIFFEMDVKAIARFIDNKMTLKKIVPYVHPEYRLSVYSEVIDLLPKDKAKKYGGYTDYVEKKNDLSFFYEESVSSDKDETVELKRKVHSLEKEIENLKKEKEKNKDKTEAFGEKIFQ